MAKEKGASKTGGRTKGTPNRATSSVREWIGSIINDNRKQFENDLSSLEPKERVYIIEKLMSYTTPKMQSVSFEAQLQAEYDVLIKLLDDAPDEAIDRIAEKVIKLKQGRNG